MLTQDKFEIFTKERGLINITHEVDKRVTAANVKTGICHLFLHHTSASLILCENADSLVQSDLEAFMQRLIPDGDPLFQHIYEGPDDMPSHVRSVLTTNFISVPIANTKLGLGTWQGIFLWEHRFHGHQRKLTLTIMGE